MIIRSNTIDYQKLNKVIRKDNYPLPQISDTLDTLAGLKWFSAVDLKSGYCQVDIHSEEKEKSVFTTEEGLWQFTIMTFVLTSNIWEADGNDIQMFVLGSQARLFEQ